MASEPREFNARAVMRLTGLTHRRLVYLDKTGLVRPSVRAAMGSGSRRVYSFEDLVELRVLAEMRRAGFSLQALRSVVESLRKRHAKPLSTLHFNASGKRLYLRTDSPKTVEELTSGGQLTMVLALGQVVEQLNEKVAELSAPQRFAVRVGKRSYEAVATPDLEAGGYSIAFPELPGCFSEADNLREAKTEARGAVEAYLGAGVVARVSSKREAR